MKSAISFVVIKLNRFDFELYSGISELFGLVQISVQGQRSGLDKSITQIGLQRLFVKTQIQPTTQLN